MWLSGRCLLILVLCAVVGELYVGRGCWGGCRVQTGTWLAGMSNSVLPDWQV